MKRSTYMTTISGMALGALAISTVAAAHEPRRQPQHYQQGPSIHQGVRDGSITRNERKALVKERSHIAQMRRRALADGKVTRQEAKKITKAQEKYYRDVYRARHNDRYRDTGDRWYSGRYDDDRYRYNHNRSYWERYGLWWR